MNGSPGRIVTTHTGSLPRPDDLLSEIIAKDSGEVLDTAVLGDHIHSAVREIVRKQASVGVDVLNDGELSKPSYATYVKDRLTGFSDEIPVMNMDAPTFQLNEFPDFIERWASVLEPATKLKTASCHGPVAYRDLTAVQKDIDNLHEAAKGVAAHDLFMTAASPGVIALFFRNFYYSNEEDYLAAISAAMRPEYEAIYAAGLVLQLDCPDLATPHIGTPTADYLRNIRARIEALNEAVANIPAEAMRLHVCWGNGELPRNHDVPLKDIIEILLGAKPAGLMLMASNGRHAHEYRVFEDVKLPEGKYLVPGVIDSTSNVIEHPEVVADRLVRYGELVGRENIIAGSDCGFGTVAGVQIIAPTIVWAKLEAMSQGAALASKALW